MDLPGDGDVWLLSIASPEVDHESLDTPEEEEEEEWDGVELYFTPTGGSVLLHLSRHYGTMWCLAL